MCFLYWYVNVSLVLKFFQRNSLINVLYLFSSGICVSYDCVRKQRKNNKEIVKETLKSNDVVFFYFFFFKKKDETTHVTKRQKLHALGVLACKIICFDIIYQYFLRYKVQEAAKVNTQSISRKIFTKKKKNLIYFLLAILFFWCHWQTMSDNIYLQYMSEYMKIV